MGTGSFLGVKSGQGVTLTPHPLYILRRVSLPLNYLRLHPKTGKETPLQINFLHLTKKKMY
jgi:hypothetical protein